MDRPQIGDTLASPPSGPICSALPTRAKNLALRVRSPLVPTNCLGVQRLAAFRQRRPDKLIQLWPSLPIGNCALPRVILIQDVLVFGQQKSRKVSDLCALDIGQLLANIQEFLGFAAHDRILSAVSNISTANRSPLIRVGRERNSTGLIRCRISRAYGCRIC